MAIYHLEAKIITRGEGRSAVAAAAYMSCSQMYNDYDGVQHDYTRKQGLVWQQIFLPDVAPSEWKDREILWNAVEEAEKTKDSRLAREFVAALPVELDKNEWIALLTDFIQANFVTDGMCADVCIHDTDGHNPHAHIMLTIRPLTKDGKWQHKTEKEYLCVRNGEEKGFTAAEFKAAQADGWEKQYQYKVGKKKVYMTPSQAEPQGHARVSKYPKSTKYGRQNPISARWNSEEQLVLWRAAWAEMTNRLLIQAGIRERIDHRSHAERGLDEQPAIHEGVTARLLEQKGIISDRCELNRQIKADNALLKELKALVRKLMDAIKNSVSVIAEAMEMARQKMILFQYQLLHIGERKKQVGKTLQHVQPDLKQYEEIIKQLRSKAQERHSLLEEKKHTPALKILQHGKMARQIDALTKEIEKLKAEKALLLNRFSSTDDHGMAKVKQRAASMESSLEKLNQGEIKYKGEMDAALAQYARLREQSSDMDTAEVEATRMLVRPEKESEALRQLKAAYGRRFDYARLAQCRKNIAGILNEDSEPASIRQQLRHPNEAPNKQHRTKLKEWDR